TLFDADVENEAKDVGTALASLIDIVDRATNPLAPLLDRLPLPSTRRRAAARKRLDAIIYGFIADHRSSQDDRGDLLSMLLLAQDEEAAPLAGAARMTDKQVRDEALTLFLAGHETTALALTWTFVLLANHPEVEERLVAEVKAVLGDRPRPSADDVPRLSYVRMVMSEAIRLYPPAWVIGRQALEDHEIAGTRIRAGSLVMLSPYVSHRDPRTFPDPGRFDPERFSPDRAKERPPFTYFPFGGGMRVCIGEAFAWMEGILAIATFARHWQLRLLPGQDLGLHPAITLRPRSPIRMVAQARQ
ncbi:MAG: cytochrome P450, partial [Cyanobacteria bacterium REEB65]|nr:cytochrome P450 [Cyanobacteria bacterium REEB65]